MRQHLKMSGMSYRVDETYIKVGKSCKCLYRAFMLSAKRDVSAAKRFFKKKVRASQCFKHFHTAERTLEDIEAVNMMRNGQVKRLVGSDAMGQAKLVASLFQTAA